MTETRKNTKVNLPYAMLVTKLMDSYGVDYNYEITIKMDAHCMYGASTLKHIRYAESEGKWTKKNVGDHVETATLRQSILEKELAAEEVVKLGGNHTQGRRIRRLHQTEGGTSCVRIWTDFKPSKDLSEQ